jgi:virulence-associated protein VagC
VLQIISPKRNTPRLTFNISNLPKIEVYFELAEIIITTAKAYRTDNSKVIVIPRKLRKELGEENTDLFIIKLDDKKRIILEPIKKVTSPANQ